MKNVARMPHTAFAVLGIAILCIAGCASIQVQTDYDESAPFESYKTYVVERPRPEPGPGGVRNPWLTKEIVETIRPILEAKGLTQVESR